MHNIDKSRFIELWREHKRSQFEQGLMDIDEWTLMSQALHEYCENNNLEQPEENGPVSKDYHKAFIEGAKHGYRRASERAMNKQKIHAKTFSNNAPVAHQDRATDS